MSTSTKSRKKTAAFNLPFSAVTCLYKSAHGKKIVCEIDIAAVRTLNEPHTIDEMLAEAHFEYVAGKTKRFTHTKKLIAYLNK